MKRLFAIAACLCATLVAGPSAAVDVAGVPIEDHARAGTAELQLNGAGLRTKLFFKVYVIALYAPQKSSRATELIDSTQPRRVVLHMLRQVDADSMLAAFRDGLRDNLGDAGVAGFKPQIERLESIMRAIGTSKPGDRISIDFTSEGTTIGINGQDKGSISGASFGGAMLKIWLGDKPIDDKLKQALLGG
jgi:long-chain acyl-CoA synthetase